jgi:hypothetical protein
MLSSITIGLSGAFTEMHPPARPQPNIAITPAQIRLVPLIGTLCASRAGLVNLSAFMA